MHDSAFALARSACLYVLATFALAAIAASRPLVRDFHHTTVVDLLESHIQGFFGRFDLLHLPPCGLPSASAAEETIEDIIGICLGSLGAVLIINPSLFRIGERLICLRYLFELHSNKVLPSKHCRPSYPDGIFWRVLDTVW